MKIKKIHAKDMTDAMAKIKDELGKDAVILNSKKIEKGGFLGLFKTKNIEVIAALDSESPRKAPANDRRAPRASTVSASAGAAATATIPPDSTRAPASNEPERKSKDTSALEAEMIDLKKLLLRQSPVSAQTERYPEPLEVLNRALMDQEITDEHRLKLMEEMLRKWYRSAEDSPSYETTASWLKEKLYEDLAAVDYTQVDYSHKYVNIVGPTGVGKTTTAAKIGAEAAINDGKSVAFITTDTFRIAAIEQLKTYAKILNVPLEVAYSLDDFRGAVEKFSAYDLVIIDSAGRNFRNSHYVKQLKEMIDFNNDIQTHLVLAVTGKYRDMKTIIEQFQLITIHKLIFTKVDETDSVGAMFNAVRDYQIGISYITHGQNVPDDISGTSAQDLAERLMRR